MGRFRLDSNRRKRARKGEAENGRTDRQLPTSDPSLWTGYARATAVELMKGAENDDVNDVTSVVQGKKPAPFRGIPD